MRWRSRGGAPGKVACGALVLLVGLALFPLSHPGHSDDSDHPAIGYETAQPRDEVARLQERLDRGEVTLKRDPVRGYLPAVLRELRVPVSSQTLVFSKTSLHRDYISPRTPRALYFNDETYVGWIRHAPLLELAAVDPHLGTNFYVLDAVDPKPRFVRRTAECLQCHTSARTGQVPGLIVRSIFTDATGQPYFFRRNYNTTDASPWSERWGGWYVTGTHGQLRHLGNLIARSEAEIDRPNLEAGANVKQLRRYFDPAPFLTPHSDLVALMLLQHQAHLHNLIIRAGYETRMALHYEEGVGEALGRPAGGHLESTHRRVKSAAEPLVRALLFSGETPLTSAVAGTSSFAREFPARGPRDRKGRSLRDLDLKTRLLRYPCSYLIYSEQFEQLPALAKEYVFRRLREVLSGEDTSEAFTHLTPATRQTLHEILTDTLPAFQR